MALGGFDELVSAAATAAGRVDPFKGSPATIPGTSLEIAQLEGSNPITVVLRDRAMPYRGASWEVQQRTKIIWYPGNPVATQQVLGPEELPTSLNGMWKSRFLPGAILVNGDAKKIQTARDAVELFEGLALAAKLVRVQWGAIVRTGLLTRFKPSYDRVHDVTWEMEFEWQSRNDAQAVRGSAATDAGKPNDLNAYMNRVENIAALVPLAAEILASDVALVIDSITRVRAVASDLFQVLRVVDTLVNLPANVIGSVRANAGMLQREVVTLMQRTTGPRLSALNGSAAIKAPTSDPTIQRQENALATSTEVQEIQFDLWRRSVAAAAAELQFAAQRQVAAVLRRAQPATVQLFTVGELDDLYSISTRFYGVPDFANFLARANRLTSVLMPVGVQLRIPPRPSGANAGNDVTWSQTGRDDPKCC